MSLQEFGHVVLFGPLVLFWSFGSFFGLLVIVGWRKICRYMWPQSCRGWKNLIWLWGLTLKIWTNVYPMFKMVGKWLKDWKTTQHPRDISAHNTSTLASYVLFSSLSTRTHMSWRSGLVFIEPVQVQVGLRKVTPALPPPSSPPGELLGCQIVRWLGGQVDISRLLEVTMSQMWPGRPSVGN